MSKIRSTSLLGRPQSVPCSHRKIAIDPHVVAVVVFPENGASLPYSYSTAVQQRTRLNAGFEEGATLMHILLLKPDPTSILSFV